MAPKKKKTSKLQFKEGNNSVKESSELERDASAQATEPELQASAQATEKEPEASAPATEPQDEADPGEGNVTSTETAKVRSRGVRSICAMHKVVVKKAQGKKFKVRYNERGNPAGDTRHTLQSYIGMLARTMVPIDILSWPNVDEELKEKLWNDVQAAFKVSPESRALVLKSAGAKWRQFKSNLTTDYVLPYVGQKKKLRNPPKKYAYVCKDVWRAFVAQRTNDKWLGIREKQCERVKKRKYPHRLSRKGYIGLQEEEVKKGNFKPGEPVDRAILWKKARKRKNDEEVDEELIKIYEKIDSLLESKARGELHMAADEDVLSIALETPEHSGRVRGVGGFVTPKAFFNTPSVKRTRITKAELLARDRHRDEEMERRTKEMMSQIAELKVLVSSSTNLPSPMMSDKESCQKEQLEIAANGLKPPAAKQLNVEFDCVAVDPTPPGKKGMRSCELAVESVDNKVAFGRVIDDEDMNKTIHGTPIHPGCFRVSVDGSIDDNALVPVPVPGEIVTVSEAVGSHLAWPKDLVIFPTIVKKKRQVTPKGNDQMKRLGALFKKLEPNKNVPTRYKLLYKHAVTTMKETGISIEISCDAQVFGTEKTRFILHENVISLCEFGMVGQAVISAYMAYLHTVLHEKKLLDNFAFIDPSASFTPNAEFEALIVKRLQEGNPDRIFFMPHNQNCHWILIIIWESSIYTLNPLPHSGRFPELEKSLKSALRSFNAQTGRANRIAELQNLPGSPKQPGATECGYVVMRYIRDIIFYDDMYSFSTKWLLKTRTCYDVKVLDEVRLEALDFIEKAM